MTTSFASTSSDLSPLPPSVYDVLLRLAPSDLLLFDTSLICQYAAPTAVREWLFRSASARGTSR